MTIKRLLLLLLGLCLLLPAAALGEQKPVIHTTSLSGGMAGVHYGTRISATGEQPMLFHLVSGEGIDNVFPAGMKLSENGGFYGTPTTPGLYQFQVRVTNPAGSSYITYNFRVEPYDESKLRPGGEDPSIIGEGEDTLSGVANAINGGRATMQGDTVYFVDGKGFLFEISAPFNKKPARMFAAREYRWLDSNESTLYYYQRYLDNEATEKYGENTFVTRIAEDPIVGRGRNTLLSLQWEDFSSLSITNEVLVYIGYDHAMGRVKLENKGHTELRMYHAGREVKADMALPYNGYVYFREPESGHLYRAPLDGQLALPVVEEPVLSFTPARQDDEVRLFFADAKGEVHSVTLEGEDKETLEGAKAGTLNANEQALFFTDANNKGRLTMLENADPEQATVLSDFAVNQVYASEDRVVFQKNKSKELWVLTLGTEDDPVRIVK